MKNKKGKKLVVLGAMAALLTLIGVSGSQTYAKYVESKEVTSQKATVAKWGFVLNADGSNLFSTDYSDTGAALSTVGGGVNLSASSYDAKEDIVQPGGNGSFSFTLIGNAEVAAQLKLSLKDGYQDIFLKESSALNAPSYNPIKWTFVEQKYSDAEQNTPVGAATTIADGVELSVLDSLIDTHFTNVKFAPKTQVSYKFTLSWEWDFDTNGETGVKDLYTDDPNDTLKANVADTYLAILSKGEDSLQYKYSGAEGLSVLYNDLYSVVTTFSLDISLEQVQSAA